MAVDPATIGNAFVDTYVAHNAGGKVAEVGALYGDDSMLSHDGTNLRGKAAIAGQVAARFAGGAIALRHTSKDFLPSAACGGIVVVVTGDMTQGGTTAKFTQVQTLFPTSVPGGLYVRNDVFRSGPGAVAVNNAAGGELAEAFVRQYYTIFDGDRKSLTGVLRDSSLLVFETTACTGAAAIVEKLTAVGTTKHAIETLDSQPLSDKVVLVVVTGKITLEGQENPLMFSEVFTLVTDATGVYVECCAFKLNYG